MDKNGLSSFLLGLGLGIGLGILFAPKSGQETRRYIKDKTGEGADYVKARTEDIKKATGELVDKGRDVLGRQKESLADAVEAGKQAYREAVSQPGPSENLAD
jgi:gas vesicle protein